MLPYPDRPAAGRMLASLLEGYRNRPDLIVLALPRGGVPVAFEVAQALEAPLDVFLVRKLGVPIQEELAFGAIASGGVLVINEDIVRAAGLVRAQIDAVAAVERRELERRERTYRQGLAALDLRGKTVLLIDDGLATGSTMLAAVRAVRAMEPRWIAVAVPVAALSTCEDFRHEANDIVCAATPEPFRAVGLWYRDFRPTTDEEVQSLLTLAWQPRLPQA